jgi:hypothetical protein
MMRLVKIIQVLIDDSELPIRVFQSSGWRMPMTFETVKPHKGVSPFYEVKNLQNNRVLSSVFFV